MRAIYITAFTLMAASLVRGQVDPCGHHGSMNNDTNTCVCDSGWSGTGCQTLTCLNGGKQDGDQCDCDRGYYGVSCESGPCWGRGFLKSDGSKCDCNSGYSGDFCADGRYEKPVFGMTIAILVMVGLIFLGVVGNCVGILHKKN